MPNWLLPVMGMPRRTTRRWSHHAKPATPHHGDAAPAIDTPRRGGASPGWAGKLAVGAQGSMAGPLLRRHAAAKNQRPASLPPSCCLPASIPPSLTLPRSTSGELGPVVTRAPCFLPHRTWRGAPLRRARDALAMAVDHGSIGARSAGGGLLAGRMLLILARSRAEQPWAPRFHLPLLAFVHEHQRRAAMAASSVARCGGRPWLGARLPCRAFGDSAACPSPRRRPPSPARPPPCSSAFPSPCARQHWRAPHCSSLPCNVFGGRLGERGARARGDARATGPCVQWRGGALLE